MRSAKLSNLVPALACTFFIQACGFGDRDEVLVLVRADDPVSRSIGDFYASSRNIPAENVLALDLSARADANNIDVATFEAEIAEPIESYLETHDPERRISLLVTTRGIPLQIGDCPRTDPHYPRDCRSAAVDAALASLGRLAPARSAFEDNANPFFADARSFEVFRNDAPDSNLRFLVARLTGPKTPIDPESGVPIAIRELITPTPSAASTQAMEATDDPPTWQVFANGPVETRPAVLTALLEPAVDVLERRGQRVCDGCRPSGRSAGLLMQDEPSAEQAKALPARLEDPGLVITLNGPETPAFDAFVARWLERGARIISTHLGDPSLGGVTRPAIQLRDWTEGRTAVEAHFRSVPHLGWVNVFVGDPLLARADASPDELGDRDGDGVPDPDDNCLTVSNPAQRDSNGDRVGNRCDPDVDDDGRVVTSWGRIYPVEVRGDLELIALTAQNGPHDPDHDLDGDGRVDENDVALAQLWLFRQPGPSQPADKLANQRR